MLKEVIIEGWDTHHEYIPREVLKKYLEKSNRKHQIVIMGPRRSGKSYSLHQIRDAWIKDSEDILYMNFEDFRLLNF